MTRMCMEKKKKKKSGQRSSFCASFSCFAIPPSDFLWIRISKEQVLGDFFFLELADLRNSPERAVGMHKWEQRKVCRLTSFVFFPFGFYVCCCVLPIWVRPKPPDPPRIGFALASLKNSP